MLEGKSIVVTGGAGALGQAVVEDFLDAGASVAVVDLADALGGNSDTGRKALVPTDLLDPESTAAMAATARERFGGIDGLVCLAGGFHGGETVIDTDPEVFATQFRLNAQTAFNAIQAVLPVMLEASAGSIACVSSRPAVRPAAETSAYAVAKLAVLKLAETVAEEYRLEGIRCNTILPSIIDTPMNRKAMPSANFTDWVAPERVAAVLRFLMSDDAAIVSGASLPVFGRA